jgi:RimJ/RimL family protein N-acetyltransferase
LPEAYSIVEKRTDDMIGFLPEVDPELPADIAEGLSGKGRTLAFAVFPPYQRQGYMEEALNAYISQLFQKQGADYIHCGHFSDNEPSSRLLQKIGFQQYTEHMIRTRLVIDRLLRRDRLQ